MSDVDQDQKTEQATDKKLTEAHDRGQFAKSTELSLIFPIAALLGVFALTAQTASRDIADYAVSIFTRFATISIEPDTVAIQLGEGMFTIGRALLPLLFAIVVATLLAGGLQSGFRLTSKVELFKIENLDIAAGFGRIFSKSVFVRTGIDVLKLIAIGSALWFGARGLM